jgi:hypothetical protein
MNRAIFERIEVGPEAEITGTEQTPLYKALSAGHPGLSRPTTCRKAEGSGDRGRPARVRPLSVPSIASFAHGCEVLVRRIE